jgi:hypothetical protein
MDCGRDVIAAALARRGAWGGSLFLHIQSLYAFFAPPCGGVPVGYLSRRINGQGATLAVTSLCLRHPAEGMCSSPAHLCWAFQMARSTALHDRLHGRQLLTPATRAGSPTI